MSYRFDGVGDVRTAPFCHQDMAPAWWRLPAVPMAVLPLLFWLQSIAVRRKKNGMDTGKHRQEVCPASTS